MIIEEISCLCLTVWNCAYVKGYEYPWKEYALIIELNLH